jgi:hypothetical protein
MFAALALLAGAIVCGTASAQALSIRERWTMKGAPGTLEFGSVDGMSEAADGSIWISDATSKVIATLNASGGGLRVVAEEGDGPGEVRGPSRSTLLPSGETGVYDMIRSAVDVFGPGGRFRRRVALPVVVFNPKGFAALGSGDFVLSGGVPSRAGAIHQFSPDGRLRRSWGPPPTARNARAAIMIAGGPVYPLPDGSILFSQSAPHWIAVYAPLGQRTRAIAANPSLAPLIGDRFVQERDGKRTFDWDYPRSAGVYRLRDGSILNVVQNSRENLTTWEVYRPDGKLVGRTRIARVYQPWGMTRNGDVLASYLDPDTDEAVAARLTLTIR